MSTVASVDMDSAQINEAALTASGNKRWKRIMLLIIAITVHNIPGRFCKPIMFKNHENLLYDNIELCNKGFLNLHIG